MKIQNKLIICVGIAMVIGLVSSIPLFGMKRPRTGTSPEESPDITQHQDIQYQISQKFQQFPMIQNAINFFLWEPNIIENTSRIRSIATNNDLVVLASADRTVKIWDMTTGQQLMPYADHDGQVNKIAISGDIIASGSLDDTVNIWKTNGETLYTFKENNMKSLAINRDKVVTGTLGGIINVRSLTTGKVLRTLSSFFGEIKINDDNKMIVISDSGNAEIWDINTGELIHRLEAGLAATSPVAINSDKAITRTMDTLKIWNVNTGKLLHTIKDENTRMISSIAINDDTIVTASLLKFVAIWNINTGQLLRSLKMESVPTQVEITNNKIVIITGNNLAQIWPIDPLNGTPDTNPLLWIIYNASVPQLDFIKRAYEATVATDNQELVIAFPSEDAKIFLSFPMHVKQYLLARLKIRR